MVLMFLCLCAAGDAKSQTPYRRSPLRLDLPIGGGVTVGQGTDGAESGMFQIWLEALYRLNDQFFLGGGGFFKIQDFSYVVDKQQQKYDHDLVDAFSIPLKMHMWLGSRSYTSIYAGPSIDFTLGDRGSIYQATVVNFQTGFAYHSKELGSYDLGLIYPLTNPYNAPSTHVIPFTVRLLLGFQLWAKKAKAVETY
jgi:hypothetical protein